MTEERLVSPRKIAVLHAKALGDLIVTLPALTAIKQTYPEAELTLLTQGWIKEFLSGRQLPVDRIITLPSLSGLKDTPAGKGRSSNGSHEELDSPELKRFFKVAKAEAFDAALHMQGDGEFANPILRRLGAKLTAGARIASAEPLDRSIPYVRYQNEILRNLEVAGLIGVHADNLTPVLETTVQDAREIADILESFGGEPFIILHPGADDIRRRWPAVKFAAVADAFTERGYQVVLTGTPKEKPLITEIIQYMQRTALAQTSLSLGALAALLARASLVISNDTGPLHLARAVKTRTVGIIWMPNLLSWGPLSSKNHRVAVSWQLECPKCKAKLVSPSPHFQPSTKCDHPFSFVESVSISEVITHASDLLENAEPILA
jgi:ADP-heptose:LPS heptosyltransferase